MLLTWRVISVSFSGITGFLNYFNIFSQSHFEGKTFPAALFGIVHYMNDIEYGCQLSNGIFTPFLLGIVFGTLQEQTSNPLHSTIAHMFHNTLWGVIVSGAGKYA